MMQSISNYASDAVGIEKSLKLLQNASQIAANIGYWSPKEAGQWANAKDQFALARRYFRLFKWVDCWRVANDQYQSYMTDVKDENKVPKRPSPAQNSIHFLLIVSKWSLLGMYLFVEMFTIVDAVSGTWRPWAVTAQTEALKIWVYALASSVLLDLYEIMIIYSAQSTAAPTTTLSASKREQQLGSSEPEKPAENDKDRINTPSPSALGTSQTKCQQLYRQLVIDSCDLLIPSVAVGWLVFDPVTVGVAGSISALVGGSDAWARVNS